MIARDSRVDDGDADALAGDAVLAAREGRADGQPGAFHRVERGPIDHHALNPRVGGDGRQHEIVDFANLRAAIETTADNAAPEDAHVGVALELHNDAGAPGQLTSAMAEYFAPLNVWLTEQNKGEKCGW